MVDIHKCPVDTFPSYRGVFRRNKGVIVQIKQGGKKPCKPMISMGNKKMPKLGIEPRWYCYRWILSPCQQHKNRLKTYKNATATFKRRVLQGITVLFCATDRLDKRSQKDRIIYDPHHHYFSNAEERMELFHRQGFLSALKPEV
jgi:hypothetical protein